MWKCKFCLRELLLVTPSEKANHTRWCLENPKGAALRDQARQLQAARSQLAAKKPLSEEARQKISSSVKAAWLDGRIHGVPHTDKAKRKISEAALRSNHRRLLKSCRTYVKKNGDQVLLDSSWEEALAKRLDDLDIEWKRPNEPIKWFDGSKDRNYFPDFWLPASQIFLDPKNPVAKLAQTKKIAWLQQHRPDVKFIWTLHECINFVPP